MLLGKDYDFSFVGWFVIFSGSVTLFGKELENLFTDFLIAVEDYY
jgi:hypothetical protein